MEAEDAASTDRMVGAEGANVCVIADKSKHFISQCDTHGVKQLLMIGGC